jgi:hypothetical protein
MCEDGDLENNAETHTPEIVLVARKVLVKGYEKRMETERESHPHNEGTYSRVALFSAGNVASNACAMVLITLR